MEWIWEVSSSMIVNLCDGFSMTFFFHKRSSWLRDMLGRVVYVDWSRDPHPHDPASVLAKQVYYTCSLKHQIWTNYNDQNCDLTVNHCKCGLGWEIDCKNGRIIFKSFTGVPQIDVWTWANFFDQFNLAFSCCQATSDFAPREFERQNRVKMLTRLVDEHRWIR